MYTVQVRHAHIKVPWFVDTMAKKIGQSLQRSSDLEELTLCVREDSATKQTLKFQNTQLQLDYVSELFLILLLELNEELLQQAISHNFFSS